MTGSFCSSCGAALAPGPPGAGPGRQPGIRRASSRKIVLALAAAVVVAAALGVALYFGLSGGGTDSALLGTCRGAEDGDTMEFRSDGTLIWTSPGYGRQEIEYSAHRGRLTLENIDAEGTSGTLRYSVKNGGLTIFSPDGEGHAYARERIEGD